MIINLGPRKNEPYQRIVLQIVLSVLLVYFTVIIIAPSAKFLFMKHYFEEKPLAIWGAEVFLVLFNFMYFHQLWVLPFWVNIDDEQKVLTARYIFKPLITFKTDDITSYSKAVINLRSTSIDGIIIYLNNNKTIMLSDLNLDDFRTIERFLISLKVKNSDEKQFSIFFI